MSSFAQWTVTLSRAAPMLPSVRRRDGMTAGLLVAPAMLYIVVLFVIPIGYVLLLSVTDPTVSLDNYRRMFTVPLYAAVMLNTFKAVAHRHRRLPRSRLSARLRDGAAQRRRRDRSFSSASA